MSKRTLDGFFTPQTKKPKISTATATTPPSTVAKSSHPNYPFSIPHLPPDITSELELLVTAEGKTINDQPHLDLLYFQPFIPKSISSAYFQFLRSQLPFYRVTYTITRSGTPTVINTPRYTTVFGVDDTSSFHPTTNTLTSSPSTTKYKHPPRPIPQCLNLLRLVTEAATNTTYNFCLVNYYASGTDSISFHSDDERFLGPHPAIASFSLGARRDFCMKHKPPPPSVAAQHVSGGSRDAGEAQAQTKTQTLKDTKPIKMALGSGDMVLMRGETQANWLHSVPKRTAKGGEAERGRINITFRRARVPGGTENYYRYNVGEGPVYRWDEGRGEMVLWEGGVGGGGGGQ